MLEVEKIKITDIIPSDYNPRIMPENEANKLKNSLESFGLVDPIVINLNNNHIIGGHQRFDVLIDQHLEDNTIFEELNLIKLGDIGWVFSDTDLKIESEHHEKALNLALNNIGGGWDYDKLPIVLKDLELADFNMDLTGFNGFDEELEFKNILNKIEYEDAPKGESTKNTEDDPTEEVDAPGYYQITILFDSEDEMTEAFDDLVEQGFNCRMSDS